MNWLTNYVRPKIRALYAPREVPENLWHKCPNCEAMLFHRELEENLRVCQHCGFHMRLDPAKRLASLFDDGAYETEELPKPPVDPLRFRDQKRYTDRLKEAQSNTGRSDAIVVGLGKVGGVPTVVAAFDFSFMGGSMGMAVGDGIVAAARLAVRKKAPLVVVPASGGARMQEGMVSLMQMPRTVIATRLVKEAGLPFIVVMCDPTTGGVTASFAMLGDIHIAEKGSQIGFAGARVIESTIRETLPEGFQRAEYLLEHGMVDMVVHRKDLKPTLARVIDLLTRPRIPTTDIGIPPLPPRAEPAEDNAAELMDGTAAAEHKTAHPDDRA